MVAFGAAQDGSLPRRPGCRFDEATGWTADQEHLSRDERDHLQFTTEVLPGLDLDRDFANGKVPDDFLMTVYFQVPVSDLGRYVRTDRLSERLVDQVARIRDEPFGSSCLAPQSLDGVSSTRRDIHQEKCKRPAYLQAYTSKEAAARHVREFTVDGIRSGEICTREGAPPLFAVIQGVVSRFHLGYFNETGILVDSVRHATLLEDGALWMLVPASLVLWRAIYVYAAPVALDVDGPTRAPLDAYLPWADVNNFPTKVYNFQLCRRLYFAARYLFHSDLRGDAYSRGHAPWTPAPTRVGAWDYSPPEHVPFYAQADTEPAGTAGDAAEITRMRRVRALPATEGLSLIHI